MTRKKLKKVLEKHELWLNGKKGGERANLSEVNLRNANLIGVNLNCACLQYADLTGAVLSRADLSFADLRGAKLRDANLCNANLIGVVLRNADLTGADLADVNLKGADLSRADLTGAYMIHADVRRANFAYANLDTASFYCVNSSFADLTNANLSNVNLGGASLKGALLSNVNLENVCSNIDTDFYHLQCPEEGSFIAWKKANGKIVKLEILADAKRSSATSRKCRCSAAKVLEIQNLNGSLADVQEVASDHDSKFVYRVGEVVQIDDFDNNRWEECAPGIHFFITREEAVLY